MKNDFFMVLVVIGLSGVMVVESTLATMPVQPLFSSLEQQPDDEQQDGSGGDEPETPEPVPEPADKTYPDPLDGGGLIEKEKECPKGEYDNNGKCTRILECPPQQYFDMGLKQCRGSH